MGTRAILDMVVVAITMINKGEERREGEREREEIKYMYNKLQY
jgi:hypothetical protein